MICTGPVVAEAAAGPGDRRCDDPTQAVHRSLAKVGARGYGADRSQAWPQRNPPPPGSARWRQATNDVGSPPPPSPSAPPPPWRKRIGHRPILAIQDPGQAPLRSAATGPRPPQEWIERAAEAHVPIERCIPHEPTPHSQCWSFRGTAEPCRRSPSQHAQTRQAPKSLREAIPALTWRVVRPLPRTKRAHEATGSTVAAPP